MRRSLPTFIVLSLLFALLPPLRADDASKAREWRDQTGQFSLQATIVAVERKAGRPLIKLRKADGSVIAVPYAKLSQEDQKFSVEWYKKQKAAPKDTQDKPLPEVGDDVKVHWGSKWWNASIVEVDGERLKIHYDGWGDNWDEWKTAEQLRWRDDSPVVPGGPADPAMATKTAAPDSAVTPAAPTAKPKTPTSNAVAKSTAPLSPTPPTRGGGLIPARPSMATPPRMPSLPRIPPVPRPFAGPGKGQVAETSPAPEVEIRIPDSKQPAKPSPASKFPAELSPQQTLEHLKTQLLAGELQAFWDWLPDDFRAYVNSRQLRDQLEVLAEEDDDLPGFTEILKELVVVMRKQKEFVLNSPILFSSLKSEESRQLLHNVYDPATDLLDEFTQLLAHFDAEIRSENFDAAFRQRLDRIGPRVAAVLQTIPPEALQTVWDHLEVKAGPTGAQLLTERVDGSQGVFPLTRVDGRWLPSELVDFLSAMPEELQKKVAKRKTASQDASDAEAFGEQMAGGFEAGLFISLLEGLQELAAANTQGEFDTALYGLTIKVQLLAIRGL